MQRARRYVYRAVSMVGTSISRIFFCLLSWPLMRSFQWCQVPLALNYKMWSTLNKELLKHMHTLIKKRQDFPCIFFLISLAYSLFVNKYLPQRRHHSSSWHQALEHQTCPQTWGLGSFHFSHLAVPCRNCQTSVGHRCPPQQQWTKEWRTTWHTEKVRKQVIIKCKNTVI